MEPGAAKLEEWARKADLSELLSSILPLQASHSNFLVSRQKVLAFLPREEVSSLSLARFERCKTLDQKPASWELACGKRGPLGW